MLHPRSPRGGVGPIDPRSGSADSVKRSPAAWAAMGHVCSSEFDILKQLGAERELGLEPHLLPHIVHRLCEELLAGGYETGSLMGNVDDSTSASSMAEISAPVLQRTGLRLSLAAARADGHLADGEALVVEAARHHWKLVNGEESSATTSARRHAA